MRVALFLLLDFLIVFVVAAVIAFLIALFRHLKDKRHHPVASNLQSFQNPEIYEDAEQERKEKAHIEDYIELVEEQKAGTDANRDIQTVPKQKSDNIFLNL